MGQVAHQRLQKQLILRPAPGCGLPLPRRYPPRCTIPEARLSGTFGWPRLALNLGARQSTCRSLVCALTRAQFSKARGILSRAFKYYYANFLISFLSFSLAKFGPFLPSNGVNLHTKFRLFTKLAITRAMQTCAKMAIFGYFGSLSSTSLHCASYGHLAKSRHFVSIFELPN